VYALEIALLLVTIAASAPLIRRASAHGGESHADRGLALDVGSAGPRTAEPRGGSVS